MLVPTNESKEITKNYEELCIIRDLISLISKNSDDYDKKYMETKINLDDKLPLNKTCRNLNIEICSMIVVRALFHENNKYYPQAFWKI